MASDLPPTTPDTVQVLAEALRQEHVIVAPAMGSGDADGSAARIHRLVDQLPYPAYVALVPRPIDAAGDETDAARNLARALARRIGAPALYIVATGSSVAEALITVPQVDPSLYSLTLRSNDDAIKGRLHDAPYFTEPGVWAETALETALHPIPEPVSKGGDTVYPGNISRATVADLAARQEALQLPEPTFDDDPQEAWTRGGRIALFVALLSGIGLTVRQTVVGWPGWPPGWRRRRPVPPTSPERAVAAAAPPDPGRIRAQATSELDALMVLLDQLASDASRPVTGLTDAATLARDAVEQLLDSTDPAELVGALTLARTGRRDAERELGSKSLPYRCCYLNPTHREGSREFAWHLGEAQVTIPVCPECRGKLHAGREPDVLLVRRGRRVRPYYELDDVWARTGYGSLTDDYAARVLAARGRR
jgi:hypothetical protein